MELPGLHLSSPANVLLERDPLMVYSKKTDSLPQIPRSLPPLFVTITDSQPCVLFFLSQFNVGDLVTFYKEAKARFDEDDGFKETARAEVCEFSRFSLWI